MNSLPAYQTEAVTLKQLPAGDPNLRHLNVGGKLFTYHKQTIDKLAGVGEMYFQKLFDLQYNASNQSRNEPFIEVSPRIFEKWIDPYIRFGCLPEFESIQDAQELSTLQASVDALSLKRMTDHLCKTNNVFGPEMWQTHLGDMYWENIPKIPSEWEQIKHQPSPFFKNKTIGQTETLVFRPATINEVDANYSRLHWSFNNPRKGNPLKITKYTPVALEDYLYEGKAYWFSMTNQAIKCDADAPMSNQYLPKCIETIMFITARHFLEKIPEQAFYLPILCKEELKEELLSNKIGVRLERTNEKTLLNGTVQKNLQIEKLTDDNYHIVPCRRFL